MNITKEAQELFTGLVHCPLGTERAFITKRLNAIYEAGVEAGRSSKVTTTDAKLDEILKYLRVKFGILKTNPDTFEPFFDKGEPRR